MGLEKVPFFLYNNIRYLADNSQFIRLKFIIINTLTLVNILIQSSLKLIKI